MTSSPFIEPLPPAVDRKLRAVKPLDEEVLIQLAGDLGEDLSFGERWLVVTARRVFLMSPDDTDGMLGLPLKEITAARLEELIGGGRLALERNGEAPAFLYFSSSSAAKFAEVARGIQQLCQGEALSLPATVERIRCVRCGRLLPEKNGLCAVCAPKRRILRRL